MAMDDAICAVLSRLRQKRDALIIFCGTTTTSPGCNRAESTLRSYHSPDPLPTTEPFARITKMSLRFAAAVGGGQVASALAAVGLDSLADLPARMLSAGQRRRLALARLLLTRAMLWLLDEPTLGLDTASVERFGGVLARHRERGGIVVAATHLPLPMDRAEELALG